MRKFSFLFPVLIFSHGAAQLSGTYNIPANYTTIAAAVTALNTSGISGPVTIEINAGYTETAPAGGYALTATGTSLNPIIFQKTGVGANPLIAAYSGGTGTPGTAVQDGIWRMIGSDYVTIDGISISDPNTSNNATMEYGYGLFKASSSNGCHNNTIKNCVITLNRINNAAGTAPAVDGSRGINVMNALATSQNVNISVTSAAGANSNNRFYNNTIQNCNVGIALIGYADNSPFLNVDTGNDIGGSSSATGNTILNYGGGGTANPAAGIRTLAQYGINIANNIINNNNGAGVNHGGVLRGIFNNTAISANASITGNTLSINHGGTTTQVSIIENVSGATSANNTITINNNVITGCTNSLTTSGVFYGIYNTASSAFLNITNNTFTNNTSNVSTGTTHLVRNSGAVENKIEIGNNRLAHAFTGSVVATGALYSVYNSNAGTTTTLSVSNNTFTNFAHTNVAGSGILYFIYNTADCSEFLMTDNSWNNLNLNHSGSEYFMYNNSSVQNLLTVSHNSITNISRNAPAGNMYGYYSSLTSPGTCRQEFSHNIISNITATVAGTGSFYGLYSSEGNTSPYPKKTVFNNVLSNINMSGTGTFYGIYMTDLGDAGTSNGSAIYNNTVTTVSFKDIIYGIYASLPTSPTYAANVYSNSISNLVTNGSTSTVYGSLIGSSNAGINYYRNKIYNLTANGGTGVAHGVYTTTNSICNITNNLIGGINTPSTTGTNKSNGIYVNLGSVINIYYNTVFLNGVSSGANFGSNALYATLTPSLQLRNNIFINNSVPTGQGDAAAFKRSGNNLSTYSALSDNNIFYAGIPSSAHLIFNDGTNAIQTFTAFQSLMSPGESSSFSENTSFMSLTGSAVGFLHINTGLFSMSNNGAVNLQGITGDFEGDIRAANTGYSGAGNSPDIGADEYEPNLPPCNSATAGTITANAIQKCSGQSIGLVSNGFSTGSGTTYQWKVSNVSGGPYSNVTGGTGGSNVAHTSGTLMAGTYFYILSITCSAGTLSGTSNQVTVTVNPVPVITAAALSPSVCEGLDIVLSGSSTTGTTFNWTGPSGYTSTVQNPTITNVTVINDGIYSVVTALNGCVSSPSSVSVSVSGTTLNIIPIPDTHCNNGTSTISVVNSSASSYTWNSGAITGSIIVTPSVTTVYTLTGTNANGCVKSVTTAVTIISPTIISNGGVICGAGGGPGTLSVNAFTPAVVYWFAGPSATSSIGTGSALPVNAAITTTYYALANSTTSDTLFTTLAAGNSSLGNMFDVHALSNIVVNGFDIHVSSAVVYTVEVWYRPGSFVGFTASNAGWTLAGTITVTGIGSGTLTQVPLSFSVNIGAGQVYGFYITITSGNLNYTNGSSVGSVWASNNDVEILVGNSGGYFAVNNSSHGFNGVMHYQKPGCISPVVPVILTVQPYPTVTVVSSGTAICRGDSLVLNASGATNYSLIPATGNSLTVYPLNNTTYTVVGADSLGCVDSDTISINVLPTPTVLITQTTPSVCINSTLALTASGASQYSWSTGSAGNFLLVTPLANSIYTVFGTALNNCVGSATAGVLTYSVPVVMASASSLTLCDGESVKVVASGALTYNWNPGNFNSDTLTVIGSGPTVYTVTGSSGHCEGLAFVNVLSDPCIGLTEQFTINNHPVIFPNPSEGIINVYSSQKESAFIYILSPDGRIVFDGHFEGGNKIVCLESVAKGLYFLVIRRSLDQFIQKIIIR